jgi:hypothetical protein
MKWRIYMKKEKLEKLEQKKNEETFNSITEKKKPENQNQTHNVRKEAFSQSRVNI